MSWGAYLHRRFVALPEVRSMHTLNCFHRMPATSIFDS